MMGQGLGVISPANRNLDDRSIPAVDATRRAVENNGLIDSPLLLAAGQVAARSACGNSGGALVIQRETLPLAGGKRRLGVRAE